MKPLFLVGYMGAGKSTIGKELSALYNISHVDLDIEIEKSIGMSIMQYFDRFGEFKFRKLEHKILLECVLIKDVIISTGGGTPCFLDNMSLMNMLGITIYLNRDVNYLYNVLRLDSCRPLIKGLKQEELLHYIINNLEVRDKYYSLSNIIIKGIDFTGENIKNVIDNYIEENHIL